jgi:uncharacterized damage-inducible protein DinB
MTAQEIRTLHAFNSWASNRTFDALALIPDADIMKDMKSGLGSIHGTILHMVGAEKIWLSRWIGKPDARLIASADAPTLAAVRRVWGETGFAMAKFLGTMTDAKLKDTFTMTTAAGATFAHSYAQAIQHVVDHSTYHRGQIALLLRQLGHTPPGTGLIAFYRETAKLS